MAYNVPSISEVAEGDLGEGVSPNQIHSVSRRSHWNYHLPLIGLILYDEPCR